MMRIETCLQFCKWILSVFIGVLGAVLPLSGHAQLAPVMGAHYPENSSMGSQGSVNAVGGYGASVPLDLPAARGGLPMPVQVVYGGNTVGAAGLGWDVPLSYVLHSTTTAYRRPAQASAASPLLAHDRWSLMLDGQNIDLVRNAANTAWVARRGNSQLELRSDVDGVIVMYDGEGRTYSFSSQSPLPGGRLINGTMYLLRSISGSGANRMDLGYGISAPVLPGGGSGLAVNLTTVSYNLNPTTPNCFKHKILLAYDTAASAPLTMSVLNGAVLVRTQKLVAIGAKSKETCAASEKALSTYNFSYQSDADTKRPQLKSVTMTGQQGTPEQYVSLPVATYSYGSIVDISTNKITYRKAQSITAPPFAAPGFNISSSLSHTVGTDGKIILDYFKTLRTFIDMDGDGRPEIIDNKISTAYGSPKYYRNQAGQTGPVEFVDTGFALSGSPEIYASSRASKWANETAYGRSNAVSTVQTTFMYIDMNADGRMDRVTANGYFWEIALNTPDPADPGKVQYKTISVDMSYSVVSRLAEAGYGYGGASLQRITTVPESYTACWTRSGPGFVRALDSVCGSPFTSPRKITTTEYELRDVNGDGYPDFVYNASRIQAPDDDRLAPDSGIPYSPYKETVQAGFNGSADVMVLINIAGVTPRESLKLFSTIPIKLVDATGAAACGIARWEADAGDPTGGLINQTCGFHDVNGDGIVDRIATTNGVSSARLGTGDMTRPYDNGASIALPGPLAVSKTELFLFAGRSRPTECEPPADTSSLYTTRTTRGLRDLNGDGIVDYVVTSDVASVYMGTGTGFAPEAILMSDTVLALSQEQSVCGGPLVDETVRLRGLSSKGLYDIDGDGQPEFVADAAPGGPAGLNPVWDVYQLVPAVQQIDVGARVSSAPAAGRLIGIENGYGAMTRIGYRSAKDDINSQHRVPFPEIVVAAVGTADSAGTPLLSTTKYAYGGAEMIFDPAYDAFRFPGYRRSVVLQTGGDASAPSAGQASITDSFGLDPFAPTMDATARFKRYSKIGLTSAVTILSGNVGSDPWVMLATDVSTDTRRTAGMQYEWDARVLPAGTAPTGNELCIDMMFPYDLVASKNNALSSTDDACTQHGFMFRKYLLTWRGTPGSGSATTSPDTVKARSTVESVDDFERVTGVINEGDLFNNSDNVCIRTVFAVPAGTSERVLNAPATQTVTDCGDVARTLNQTTWEYDTNATGAKLPAGQVSSGFPTAQIVSRRNTTTGAPIVDASGKSDIRLFDISYDNSGNPVRVSKTRDDGASLTVNTVYDSFGLVPQSITTDATNVGGSKPPSQTTSSTIDQVTMNMLSSTDANGMVSSNTYDGFGRVLLSKVKPVGGVEGVMSTIVYNGFAVGQTGGRNIVEKVFTSPVPVASTGTAAGRTRTVYLDSLGRDQRTEVALGADYANQKMIVGQHIYDALGRVLFEADPFPSTESFTTAYGTTQYFNADGTPWCSIRGKGLQPWTNISNEASEIYPTCFSRGYQRNTELLAVQGPDSRLAGSPQADVQRWTRQTALGRVMERWTVKYPSSARIEFASYYHNALGQLTTMNRYQDAVTGTNPVSTTWHYDSLDRVIVLEEPGNAPQNRSYNTWGELTLVQWNDPVLGGDRRNVMKYDALGRLTHSEDRTKGLVDAETVNDYLYDVGVNNVTPAVTATNVVGRLAKAISPTSAVTFSYDGLGRVNAKVFTDRTFSPEKMYVETHETNGDGSPRALALQLPDNAFKIEKIDYAYDSAGRMRSVKYNDGINRDLFTAVGATDIDVFGRIRQAKYGAATFIADYAAAGRRMPTGMRVTSPAGKSREITFPTVAGLPAFDPVGRERVRRETRDGIAGAFDAKSSYDAIGRLQQASLQYANGSSGLQEQRIFSYDPLGNVVQQSTLDPLSSSGVALTYDSTDRDRICSVGYGTAAPPVACNVKYDGAGNIVEMPTRSNGTRTLSYFANGQTKSITNGATNASYRYDAFGDVQQLTLNSTTSADTRQDKHFGDMLTQRAENGVSVLTRTILGPGVSAVRHGPTGVWTFTIGEQRGNRFVTDQSGAFVQDIAYLPFGENDAALSSGALPGTTNYNNEQWNGGDALAALGITQLGARMYDPVIGRFLSRDPLILPRTSATTNPYAFADNDPINMSDPSGLCAGSECPPDNRTCWLFFCTGGGGGGGGSSGSGSGSGGGGRGGSGISSHQSRSYQIKTCDRCNSGHHPASSSDAWFGEGYASIPEYQAALYPSPFLENFHTLVPYVGSIVACTTGSAKECAISLATDIPFGKIFKVAKGFRASRAVGLFRRAENIGEYAGLPVLMDLKTVRKYAEAGGVGLNGIKVKIIRDPALVGKGIFGYTAPKGNLIHLYPDAFQSAETLIRTLGHERTHIFQFRALGSVVDSAVGGIYERSASEAEDAFILFWTTGGR